MGIVFKVQAFSFVEDRDFSVCVFKDIDLGFRVRESVRGREDFQRESCLPGGDDVVVAYREPVFLRQDVIQVNPLDRNEGAGEAFGILGEPSVVLGNEDFPDVLIGRFDLPDAVLAELRDQSGLPGSIASLDPAFGLRRIGEDQFDAQFR